MSVREAFLSLPAQAKEALFQAGMSDSVFHVARIAAETAVPPVPLTVTIFPPGRGPGRHVVSDGWTWSIDLATDEEIALNDEAPSRSAVPIIIDARLCEGVGERLLFLACRWPWQVAETN